MGSFRIRMCTQNESNNHITKTTATGNQRALLYFKGQPEKRYNGTATNPKTVSKVIWSRKKLNKKRKRSNESDYRPCEMHTHTQQQTNPTKKYPHTTSGRHWFYADFNYDPRLTDCNIYFYVYIKKCTILKGLSSSESIIEREKATWECKLIEIHKCNHQKRVVWNGYTHTRICIVQI